MHTNKEGKELNLLLIPNRKLFLQKYRGAKHTSVGVIHFKQQMIYIS